MQHGACCEIRKVRQDMIPRSLVGVGAWRAAERFFVEFFDFLFNNTSACYLVFASFFPTLLHSILLLCCYDYELEQFVCLSTHIYTIPHLVLSQCKINRAVTFFFGSKQLLCFQHSFKLSKHISTSEVMPLILLTLERLLGSSFLIRRHLQGRNIHKP